MTLYVCRSCRRHHRDEGNGCPFCTAQRPSLRNAWVPLAAAIALAGCRQEDDGRRAVAAYGAPTPPPALTVDAGVGHTPRNDAPAYGLAPDDRLTAGPDAGPPTAPPERPDGGRR